MEILKAFPRYPIKVLLEVPIHWRYLNKYVGKIKFQIYKKRTYEKYSNVTLCRYMEKSIGVLVKDNIKNETMYTKDSTWS